MLKHKSNAIAIQLFFGGETYKHKYFINYVNMTIIAIRRLQEIGYNEDIVIITNISEYDELYKREGAIVEHRQMFDYSARSDYKCDSPGVTQYDMQKIYYWDLHKYDKVLCIDNDMIATKKFDQWDIINQPNEMGGYHYKRWIISSLILAKPCPKIFQDMYMTAKEADFSPDNGWNNCGKLDGEDWRFQCANGTQGFLVYYFKEIKPISREYFNHYSGHKKYFDKEYIELVKRNGFNMIIPNHLLNQ